MIITWFGHSSFLIENSNKEKLLIDPYSKTLGGTPYVGSANIITISHNHFDHNSLELTNPGATIIDTPCTYDSSSFKVKGFPSFHDNHHGAKRGENIIFLIESDNLRLCHLGDLGHMLTPKELNLLQDLDVLFIPIDKNFTLAPETAALICKKLNSKIIIPMHYKTPNINFPVGGIEKFIALMKNAMNLNSNKLIINSPIEGLNKVSLLTLN